VYALEIVGGGHHDVNHREQVTGKGEREGRGRKRQREREMGDRDKELCNGEIIIL
jgi:hypothetical protein